MLLTQLPLIHAFGLYFMGLHSRTGLRDLRRGLNQSSVILWKEALPLDAGTWRLMGLLYAFKNRMPYLDLGPEGIFFGILNCLCLPYVVTMQRFYRQRIGGYHFSS
jgi:hypothetical protein